MKSKKKLVGSTTKTAKVPLSKIAANKESVVLLDSAQLCWLLVIIFFGIGIIGSWTKPNISNPTLMKSIWAQITLSIIFVVWCWQQRNNHQPLEMSWPRLVFLGFILWISVTIFWAIRVDFYIFKWMLWLTGVFVFYFCLQLRMQHIPLLMSGIALSAIAVSLIVMAQVFFGYQGIPQTAIPAGTFGNKNAIGHFMVLSLPANIYLQLRPCITLKSRLFYSISTVLVLAAIYHTTARGSWLAVGVGITIITTIFIFNRSIRQQLIGTYRASARQFKLLILLSLGLFLILISFNAKGQFILFFDLIITELSSIIETANNTSGETISHRYMIWRACLEMIKNAPLFGYGLGGFFENMLTGYKNNKSLSTFRAHNDYLEIWIETGIVGLVFYLSCLLSVLYCAFYSLKRASVDHQLLVACILSGVLSSLVNGMFSFPMQLVVPIMIISVYAAIIVRIAETSGMKIIHLNFVHILRPLLLIMSISIASIVILVNGQWWQNYQHINKIFLQRKGLYDPDTIAFHPEQVPILWKVGQKLISIKRYKHSIEMMTALRKPGRWPNEYNLLNILYDSYINLGNYRKAMQIANLGLSYGKNGLFNFYEKLFSFYSSQLKNNPEYKKKAMMLYQRFSALGDGMFHKNVRYYDILIFMNLKLGINTPEPYYQAMERAGVYLAVSERRMAFFHRRQGNREQALKHIRKFIELRSHAKLPKLLKYYLKQSA